MTVSTTYPGIYIQELPSSTHTITAAPTSIAVFIGYSAPFKTLNFNQAVELFSFADYERQFGGMFASSLIDTNLAYAVNQFFLNGGAIAYVVGLQPSFWDPATGANKGLVPSATLQIGGVQFTALEPTDARHPMTVTIAHLTSVTGKSTDPQDVADITISYGARVEVYRRVTINPTPPQAADKANFIEKRLGTAAAPISSLVAVSPVTPPGYGTAFTAANNQQLQMPSSIDPNWTTFSAADFLPAFQQDSDLDKLPIFNLMVLPGVADNGIWSEALAFCERKEAFLILDPPRQAAAAPNTLAAPAISGSLTLPWIGDLINDVPQSANGALYFPYLLSLDPLTGDTIELPPSGYVAGIYARTDQNRGVWKAPAGLETTLLNTTGVVDRGRMNDPRQGTLNPLGVNCLRDFPGIGTVVFGARTLVTQNPAFEQWRYVPVRRMALFIEQTLYRNLTWAVFEPNDDTLWVALRTTVENFMLSLFQQGAFFGDTPSKAFQVKCDSSTTTQTDIDNGIVNIIVAFAPLKPAEFVIVKIAQLAGQTQSA